MVKRMVLVCLWFAVMSDALLARSAGPPPNVNGLTGTYCTQCHRTNALNSGTGSVRLEGLPPAWLPDQVYTLRVVVTDSAARRYGFQFSATTASGSQAGEITPGSDGRTQILVAPVNGFSVQFIEHNSLGSAIGGSNTFEFTFRAPSSPTVGAIRFNFAGNAANGNGTNTGDFVYAGEASIPVGFTADSQSFSLANRGATSVTTAGNAVSPVIAQARVQASAGSSAPAGMEILTFKQNNVTVTEAAFAAAPPLRSGRIYAQIGGSTDTGLAIANPNATPATIFSYFTDANGLNFGGVRTIVAPGAQVAAFLDQSPFFTPGFFTPAASSARSFTFTSDVPVSSLALRGTISEQGEFVIAPMPVADLSTTTTDAISIPHLSDGNGWTTQVILVNPTDETLAGRVEFLTSGGQLMSVTTSGQAAGQFEYSVPPRGSTRIDTAGNTSPTQTGSIRIVPASGKQSPLGFAVFSLRSAGVTSVEVTMSGTRPSTTFRTYAEATAGFATHQPGSVRSGVAIANHGPVTANVTLEFFGLDGTSSGLTGTLSIPALGQTTVPVNEIPGFESLPASHQGVLRVSTTAPNVVVSGFRVKYNERANQLISGIPAINENSPPAADLVFPHVVDSGGYSTQLILFGGSSVQSSAGVLRFYSQSGQALTMTLR